LAFSELSLLDGHLRRLGQAPDPIGGHRAL
jgi:hypothetical protein